MEGYYRQKSLRLAYILIPLAYIANALCTFLFDFCAFVFFFFEFLFSLLTIYIVNRLTSMIYRPRYDIFMLQHHCNFE